MPSSDSAIMAVNKTGKRQEKQNKSGEECSRYGSDCANVIRV